MNIKKIIQEEINDFEWAERIKADLVPGQKYSIKSGNGYYWESVEYMGYTNNYDNSGNEGYLFKSLDYSSTGFRSKQSVRDAMEKGNIREYDPDWSIKDDIEFSVSLNDVNRKNFAIEFEGGVNLDDTIELQKKLAKKGFSFYTKNLGEFITSKDFKGLVERFECFDWNVSDPTYKSMPRFQWSKDKKMLLYKNEDSGFSDSSLAEQAKYKIIVDHDAIVIDGWSVI